MKIQDALDAANPGDLIIVNGTVSPTSNAPTGTPCNVPGSNCIATPATYPEKSGNVDHVEASPTARCGAPSVTVDANPHPAGRLDTWRSKMRTLFGLDQNGFLANVAQGGTPPAGFNPTVDILPGEMFIGVIAADGGLEPDLMSVEEGGGITVVGKNQPVTQCGTAGQSPSNFYCTPSRIDGLGFTNSQAGGGIYVHGWGHNVEISASARA